MKNITLLFCLFLANILLGACSGGEDEKKEMDEGKGAYALFLKKSITVSTGESQTDVVVEWAKTSWEITLGEGDIVKASLLHQVAVILGKNSTRRFVYLVVRTVR